jgi:hypothetical protein
MTASSGDQSPAPLPSDVVTVRNDLIVNARVTHAPLVVWKDSHWSCTITSFAPLKLDRLD